MGLEVKETLCTHCLHCWVCKHKEELIELTKKADHIFANSRIWCEIKCPYYMEYVEAAK